MQFENRNQYLEAVAQWKAEYKDLSARIRAIKHQIANESREQGYTYAWTKLANARDEANRMIGVRHQSKVDANEQYLSTRA